MARIYSETEASAGALRGSTVAVLGYEGLGRAQALNMRDSGVRVVVGEAGGSVGARRAEAEGLARQELAEAVKGAEVVVLGGPEAQQVGLYRKVVAPHLRAGQVLVLGSGFNLHARQVRPPTGVDVVVVAPKAPAEWVRRLYVEGQGVPCVVAVYQDASRRALERALACGRAMAGARASLVGASFREATEANLFSEQAVCGGGVALMLAGFETLVEAGYGPEVAYLECVHGLKRVADLLYEQGLAGMRERVGERAAYGEVTRGPRVVDTRVRGRLCELLREVQEGRFAREWLLEMLAGRPVLRMQAPHVQAHPLEEVGRRLRALMPWLGRKAAAEPRTREGSEACA